MIIDNYTDHSQLLFSLELIEVEVVGVEDFVGVVPLRTPENWTLILSVKTIACGFENNNEWKN